MSEGDKTKGGSVPCNNVERTRNDWERIGRKERDDVSDE